VEFSIIRNHKKLWATLLAGICGGVCNILVDLDHFPPIKEATGLQRPLHIPMALIAFSFSFYCISRLRGPHIVEKVLK